MSFSDELLDMANRDKGPEAEHTEQGSEQSGLELRHRLLENRKFVEILPEERPYTIPLRIAGFVADNIMRGNGEHMYMVQTEGEISETQLDAFVSYLRTRDERAEQQLFEQIESDLRDWFRLVLRACLRRMLVVEATAKCFDDVMENSQLPQHRQVIRQLFCFVREQAVSLAKSAESHEQKAEGDCNILVLTNLGQITSDGVANRMLDEPYENELRIKLGQEQKSSSLLRRAARRIVTTQSTREMLNAVLAQLSIAHPGTAAVYSELKRVGLPGQNGQIDIGDITDRQKHLEIFSRVENQYDLIMISASSFELMYACEVVKSFRSKKIPVIVGGLVGTNDTAALLQEGATVFVGEFEEMGHLVRYIRANPGVAAYHRGVPPSASDTLQDQIDIPHFGVCPVIVDKSGFRHVYLGGKNVTRRHFDLTAHYEDMTEENERALLDYMLGLEMMKPLVEVGGRQYEVPSRRALTLTTFTRGCPWRCPFCSTVEHEGNVMRRMPPWAVERLLQYTRSHIIVETGQNVYARGKRESEEAWLDYWYEVFERFERQGKLLAVQTNVDLFQSMEDAAYGLAERGMTMRDEAVEKIKTAQSSFAPDVRYLQKLYEVQAEGERLINKAHRFIELVKDVAFAALCGFEQPVPTKGCAVKDPKYYREWIRTAHKKSRTVIFGTFVVGMGAESSLTPKALQTATAEQETPAETGNVTSVTALRSDIAELRRKADRVLKRKKSKKAQLPNYIPYSDLSLEDWDAMIDYWLDWLGSLDIRAAMFFAFTVLENIPDFEAYQGRLEGTALDNISHIRGIDGRRAAIEIATEFYRFRRVLPRMVRAAFDYHIKQWLFLLFINLGFMGVHLLDDPGTIADPSAEMMRVIFDHPSNYDLTTKRH